jgi:hypothetical protein
MNYELPYDFILKELYPVRPKIKKMLGCYALLIDEKILMMLRDREQQPEFNGAFIATLPEYYEALQKEIQTSRMEFDLDGMENSWIFISEDLDDFEQKVKKTCEMIKAGDLRIGKYAV